MRCGDAIRLTTPVGIGVAETLPMTDVAPDSLLGMRMCKEIVHGSTVAGHAYRELGGSSLRCHHDQDQGRRSHR